MTTLQEQMAGPSRPRFNGWLTMAPEVDPAPFPSLAVAEPAPVSEAAASTHGFGMLGQSVRLPQRKKQRATFQVGSPGMSDDEGDSDYSHTSQSGSDAPDFDVRASFAPMPTWGKAKTSAMPLENTASNEQRQQEDETEDAGGLSFGGRQWKGKTVHAVEQELEALRDVKLMSHAPDAVYLASRLEGLRRNLEIEERRPSYVEYEEDSIVDDYPPILAHPDPSLELYQETHSAAEIALRLGVRALPALAHRPISNASSVSLAEGETPEDLEYSLDDDPATIHNPNEVIMPAASGFTKIDPAARAAALNARVDIRNLRRSDLDQVRDLHAFHGEFDQSPSQAETYASTASFLLRLLVDDRHVCLVAVAKPIPEPEAPLPAASDLARAHDAGSPDSCAASPASSINEANEPLEPESRELPASYASPSSVIGQASNFTTPESTPSSSLFLSSRTGGLLPPRRKRFLAPRGQDGRINNTPATSVFSDLLAERGAPTKRFTLDDLPGPTEDVTQTRVKKVLAIPSAQAKLNAQEAASGSLARQDSETIVGVVSARVSVVIAPSEDSLWAPAVSGNKDEPSSLIDIHLLTLAIAPEERGQGLGAKLLSALHGECMTKSRLMALRIARPRQGRSWGAIPTVPPLTPRFIDLPYETEFAADLLSSVETLPGKPDAIDDQVAALLAEASPAPEGKHLTRTFLEVHPANLHAMALYTAHGFHRPSEPSRAVKKGFYRGDTRIATRERAKPGGTDAWILERFDGLLPTK